jgi:hypothetical protein
MKKNRAEMSIFVTDESVGLFQYNANALEQTSATPIELESGIVENGKILDPQSLYRKLFTRFKEMQIKPKKIRFVIQEQNILIREISIKKDDLQKKTIANYLNEQQSKTLNFPFSKPIITYFVKEETETEFFLTIYIADEDLLQDYYDIFERLKVKQVLFDMPSLSLYHFYQKRTEDDLSNTLLATIYNRTLSIHVIEDNVPVFSMIEELEGSGEPFFENIENYLERIANYYRYNIRKDKKTIYRALIFNLADRMDHEYFVKHMGLKLKSFITTIVDLAEIEPTLKAFSKINVVAYASNQMAQANANNLTNFKIDRVQKSRLYANLIMVLSLAIFSVMSLIYIPYRLILQEIAIQENINANLSLQLEALRTEIPQETIYSQVQKDYSNAFDYLTEQSTSPNRYLFDLFSEVTANLSVISYKVDQSKNEITFVLSANSQVELNEYFLQIYENYGVIANLNDVNRWMIDEPVRKWISTYVMEVKVLYA